LCFGLYPTFKEWKRKAVASFSLVALSLYPTFKEWKLVLYKETITSFGVYILPLRNENSPPFSFSKIFFAFISYL